MRPLAGAHGYRIGVEATRVLHSHRRGEITVFVSKRRAQAMYTVRGKVTRKRLRADLGAFGRIDLRLRPHRHHPRKAPAAKRQAQGMKARGEPRVCLVALGDVTSGRFKGTLRFSGEDDYTSLRAHRGKGFTGTGKASCSSAVGGDHRTVLEARSGSLEFEAVKFGASKPLFYASKTERSGPVRIQRFAIEPGDSDDFSFDSSLTSAHVAPPRSPFSGSADFTAPHGWSGSLSVSFPGKPDVPLTGAGFSANLEAF
jgi:hypothetical protein